MDILVCPKAFLHEPQRLPTVGNVVNNNDVTFTDVTRRIEQDSWFSPPVLLIVAADIQLFPVVLVVVVGRNRILQLHEERNGSLRQHHEDHHTIGLINHLQQRLADLANPNLDISLLDQYVPLGSDTRCFYVHLNSPFLSIRWHHTQNLR